MPKFETKVTFRVRFLESFLKSIANPVKHTLQKTFFYPRMVKFR